MFKVWFDETNHMIHSNEVSKVEEEGLEMSNTV